MAGLAEVLRNKDKADAKRYGGLVDLLLKEDDSQGYNPFLKQTPGADGNNPMAQNTGGQPIPKAPHWVNSLTGLVEGSVNGFMAPYNAMTGKYDQMVIDPETGKVLSMIDPRLMDDAAAMAGLVTTSGMPMPKPAGALGIFGGTLAKTADTAALAKAEQMAAAGASRDEIWNATGWFKGKDGKWRFEIDDSGSKYRAPDAKRFENADVGDVVMDSNATVLSHPSLFPAYDDLWSIDTQITKGGGYPYQPSGKFQQRESGKQQIFVDASNLSSARSINLHELQHAIQTREGFGRGGSPSEYARGPMFSQVANKLKDDMTKSVYGGKLIPTQPTELIDLLKYADQNEIAAIAKKYGFNSIEEATAFLKQQDELRTPYSQYHRTSGEVEARNVEARKDLTPEQRRAKAPWLTQDVPDDLQIVRFNGD